MRLDFRVLLVLFAFCSPFGRETMSAEDPETTKLLQTFVDEFVSITPGTGKFPATIEMGNDESNPNERPRHTVTLTHSFDVAKFEVPQNLYEAVIGTNPSRWKGPRNSVELISWDDANQFCGKVTVMLQSHKLIDAAEIIRLPTETEWEYFCRAGTTTRYSFGDLAQHTGEVKPVASILNQYGWHTGNAKGNDPPVGALKPNAWGLYDTHGYLWEFTADEWSPDYLRTPTDGSAVTLTPETKFIVIRGGSWKDDFEKLTSSTRRKMSRTDKDDAVGFRCVKSRQHE